MTSKPDVHVHLDHSPWRHEQIWCAICEAREEYISRLEVVVKAASANCAKRGWLITVEGELEAFGGSK